MAMQKIISHSKGHKVKIIKTNPDGSKTSFFKWKQGVSDEHRQSDALASTRRHNVRTIDL